MPPAPSSSKKGLPLSELRQSAKVDDDLSTHSASALMQTAKHYAKEAGDAERDGRDEDGFVAYLRAVGFYQAFRTHKDFKKIAADGVKSPLWMSHIEFLTNRDEYMSKARNLGDKLKLRDVEKTSNPQPSRSYLPAKPPPPSSSIASHSPTNSAPTNAHSSPSTNSNEPDTTSGGSIAARLAALRGAGMQLDSAPLGRRISRDLGTASSSTATFVTAQQGGSHASPVEKEKEDSGRRESVSSIHIQSTGLSNTSANGASGNGFGKVSSPSTAPQILESNKTGSSFTSVRSFERNKTGGSSGSAPMRPSNGFGGIGIPEDSDPSPPSLSPHVSGNQTQRLKEQKTPETPPVLTPAHSGGGDKESKNPPVTTGHFHKASLPNLPSKPFDLSDLRYGLPPKSTIPSESERKFALNAGYSEVTPTPTTTVTKPTQETDDDLSQFATSFPSLDELESSPDFGMDMHRSSTAPTRYGRPSPIEEDPEPELRFPSLPSAPKHVPGTTPPAIDRSSPPTTQGLVPPRETPNRSRSLPEPDTVNGASVGGEGVKGGYFPSVALASEQVSRSYAKKDPGSLPPSPGANGEEKAEKPKEIKRKPTLPHAIGVTPAKLREYLTETSLEVLLIDMRTKEEYEKDWVGRDLSEKVDVVWIDPTVLLRPGIDANKVESSLALSPAQEQKLFARRHTFDLLVIYDRASLGLPLKGSKPTPASIFYNVIFVDHFGKALKRSPVLLIGGYEGWVEEVSQPKGRRSSAGVNGMGKPKPPLPTKKPSYAGDEGSHGSPKGSRREAAVYKPGPYSTNLIDNIQGPYPQSMSGMIPGYGTKPLVPLPLRSSNSAASNSPYSSSQYTPPTGSPTPPPQASINPGISRRRSDYVDQHNQTYSGYGAHTARPSIDYPGVSDPSVPQPPAAAASSSMDRYERPRTARSASIISIENTPASDEVDYWNDVAVGMSGLKNLGNTCYMNSTLQCLSATYPLARFFLDGTYRNAINTTNPMGTKGDLAKAFATLIGVLWKESYSFLSPVTFRKSIATFAPDFAGTEQHDSQEFLSFLLDGLHEDLNRIKHKPAPVEMTPEREAALETLPPAVAAEKEWKIYKQRNDSLIVDLFQGQYRNVLECLTCHKTSVTYDAFMYMSLPVPTGKNKVVLQQLIDDFVQVEILDKEDAWNCPRCKVPRKASKSLSIARLPPILLIHLKRFSTKNGLFWDKSETPVIFPLKDLDLTRYLPDVPSKNGVTSNDPRSTSGKHVYELFALSNHMGSLSSGHYTAFVKSSNGWQYCDDSKISPATERDVVTKPAYIQFWKRVQA